MAVNQNPVNKNADILVVDDEIANLRLLTEILTQGGYQVRSAEKPLLAIESALAYPPDLILLDVMMPEMDGFEVCQRFQEHETTHEIPIIFVSALQELDDKVRGFEAGGVDFISKPYQKSEVLARVKTHLQLHSMQLHLEELVVERTAELAQANEALRESEQRFRATFEQAAVGIAHKAHDGQFLRLNQKFCDIVGYTHQEMQNLSFQDITHPDDLNTDLANVKQLLEGQVESYSMEKRYFHKNGKTVWVSLTVSLLREDTGEPGYFISVVEDITDRKLAEEQYQTFFTENISSVFWVEMKDPIPIDLPVEEQVDAIFREAYVKDVSDSTVRMYGLTREELLGEKVVTAWGNDEYQDRNSAFHQYYQRFVRSGYVSINVEMPERTKDGRDLWLLINLKGVIEDEHLVRIWGSQIDITEHKLAEQELNESEQKYRALVEQATDGITVIQDEKIVFANKRFAEMAGRTFVGLLDTPFNDYITAEELPNIVDLYQRRLDEETPSISETVIQWKDGSRVEVEFSAGLTAFAGKPAVLVIVRDITDRKLAEKKILEYQERLKALASQLTIVEERERRRIAAELHDHVSQSLAFARMRLASASKRSSDAKLLAILADISESLLAAIKDTKDLIFDLSSPLLNEIGLGAAISEWLELEVEKKHGLKTEFIDKGAKPVLDEDVRAILFRNVRELLTNVVRHAGAGKVSVRLQAADDKINVIVEDDGVGFDPEGVTQAARREAGFGLFSIHERMNDMGGSFVIESEPGHGSKAILSIPLGS